MRRRIERGLSLLLTVVLLTALLAPAAQAAGSTVSIRTAEDLIGLARSCTLDTWSQGKTGYLEADLDLSGTAFTPIPTFGGPSGATGTPSPGWSSTAAATPAACSATSRAARSYRT